jgi:hypothetical protein
MSSTTPVAPVAADRQLIVSENVAPQLPPGDRPVIVFNALTDAQFEKALALFKPAPRTKPNLWVQKEYTASLCKAAAYCEAAMFTRTNGCFGNKIVSTNFDGCIIQKFRNNDEDFFFSIDEWFNDSRGELPAILKEWDPKSEEPMPQVETGVDWYKKLTDIDMQMEGFLDLFVNCIDLEEKMAQEVASRKHAATTAFGDHPGTRMPDPINQNASFGQFTPSGLLGGAGGSGLKFASSSSASAPAKGGFGPGRW